jgi:hypothetical protein
VDQGYEQVVKQFSFIFLILGLALLASCFPAQEVETPATATNSPPPLPRRGPATVEVVEIHQIETFPVVVEIIARGRLPDDCTTIDQISQARTGSNFKITIDSVYSGGSSCSQEPIPFEEEIELDVLNLPAGIYVVDVNGLQGTFKLQADNVPDPENGVIGGQVWHDTCSDVGAESTTEPPDGCVVGEDGSFVANGLVDPSETGLEGIVIKLGEGSCPTAGLAATITDNNGDYLFSGLKGGTYCVSIDRFVPQNPDILATGHWTFPEVGPEAAVTISLSPGESNLNLYFGWFNQTVEPFEPIEPVEPIEPTIEDCTDKAVFREDVSIPDDTIVQTGEAFTKTWKLRNSGSCSWDTDYSVVFFDGDQLGAPETIPITTTVAPGEDVDISIPMIAPIESGEYRGEWKLMNPDGFLFGIGPGADRAFWVQIAVEEN